ncbi:posphoenolpyruvate synthetase regulatory kinase/phosphorylase PpsR [Derxia gummosa]|uniref:Putative phosphoenolpyruvate synthase regulatory protein n=1 Tax=Derxia gummosa DSM 723 TaxID=1121388 RepID=A0A8B6X968_9BURK|nr:pyruvate, water dikinase regulatory protein [Derxia gummosa]
MPLTLVPSNRYERTAFFVSDGTGITAETFGHALLSQFDVKFRQVRLPFVDSVSKALEAARRINEAAERDGKRPLVFSTLVNAEVAAVMRQANGMIHELIPTFVPGLEQELGIKSTHGIGRSHTIADTEEYNRRIEAINFSLAHDDGESNKGLPDADVILVGVSRCGKTPTSLYLAMTHGLKIANYPLIPEDFARGNLPSVLPRQREKLFGLSISPDRLHQVRNERRPGSKYASIEQCRMEVNEAEALMRREGIRWLSTTTKSIEEIAATILQEIRIERKSF